MKILRSGAWLAPILALAACTEPAGQQVLTGHVGTQSGVIAIRAVSGSKVVTAAQVRRDGSWTLALPVGTTYHLEMLTSTNGVKHVIAGTGGSQHELTFDVCKPQDPWDCGGAGNGSGMGRVRSRPVFAPRSSVLLQTVGR